MNSFWRRISPAATVVLRLLRQDIRVNKLHSFISPHFSMVTAVQCPKSLCYPPIRWKSKKTREDSDDEDENLNEGQDSSLTRDSKVVKFNTTSLRVDLILKSALNIARNKVEQYFYESKIRVNGKKVMKKSAAVKIGDELDIVKSQSAKNPDHIHVYRVEILNVGVKEEAIVVTARRFRNLLIENYEKDPYKFSAAESAESN